MVAALTLGLPEQVGGERSRDYRRTWIRDASFSIRALLGLGYLDEAAAFIEWLSDWIDRQSGSKSGPLKIMYRVDGSSDLDEESLEHLTGYPDSRPVRIGNGASDQLQLDIYGAALDALRGNSWTAFDRGTRYAREHGRPGKCRTMDDRARHRLQPGDFEGGRTTMAALSFSITAAPCSTPPCF